MKRSRTRMHALSLVVALVVASPCALASDAAAGAGRALDDRRPERRAPVARQAPVRPPLPADLRIEDGAPDVAAPPEKVRPRPDGGGPGRPANGRDVAEARALETLAALARTEAERAADVLVGERGLREYYGVGLWTGLRAALDDPWIGRDDFVAGHRRASRDARAHAEGGTFGESLAEARARAAAAAAAAAEFADLAREPRYLSAPAAPWLDVTPPDRPAPTVQAVLRAEPFAGRPPTFDAGSPAPGRALLLRADLERLCAARDHRAFYDGAWREPDHALEAWLERRPALRRHLRDDRDRAVFAAAFRRAFPVAVARRHGRALHRAYDAGLDDGWSYGLFVAEELAYRRGYHLGFGEAWVAAARNAFDATYSSAWADAWAVAYDDWAGHVRPAIGAVRLVDGNADGVFEPGEDLSVEYEVLNYGGAGGDVTVRLDGPALLHAPYARLRLPARGATAAVLRDAVIRPAVRPRSREHLDLVVDTVGAAGALAAAGGAGAGATGDDRRLALDVRRPLQFAPASLRVDRDDLAGRIQVAIDVENVATRAIADVGVRATVDGSAAIVRRVVLPALGAGESRVVTFDADGLDPLDLLGGELTLGFEIAARGVVQDDYRHRVVETATDPRNRDLVTYLTAMATGSPFALTDLARARDLLLDRLRADWRDAVRASGNPYKRDRKRGAAETALGELVVAWEANRRRVTQPEVFAGLDDDVAALSRDLPGIHPFLRKAMRKLAAPLP